MLRQEEEVEAFRLQVRMYDQMNALLFPTAFPLLLLMYRLTEAFPPARYLTQAVPKNYST